MTLEPLIFRASCRLTPFSGGVAGRSPRRWRVWCEHWRGVFWRVDVQPRDAGLQSGPHLPPAPFTRARLHPSRYAMDHAPPRHVRRLRNPLRPISKTPPSRHPDACDVRGRAAEVGAGISVRHYLPGYFSTFLKSRWFSTTDADHLPMKSTKGIFSFIAQRMSELSLAILPILLIGFPVYNLALAKPVSISEYATFVCVSFLACNLILALVLYIDWLFQRELNWKIDSEYIVILKGSHEIDKVCIEEIINWRLGKAGLVVRARNKRFRMGYPSRQELETLIDQLNSYCPGKRGQGK